MNVVEIKLQILLALAGRVDYLTHMFLVLTDCAVKDGLRVRDADRSSYLANAQCACSTMLRPPKRPRSSSRTSRTREWVACTQPYMARWSVSVPRGVSAAATSAPLFHSRASMSHPPLPPPGLRRMPPSLTPAARCPPNARAPD
ncbi:hypothetical protein B0H11DRAFT_2257604 [Mycena galericulata]|nr:hypothetical protein B0H11DRAFT_2257604 [Mycena galericulata]